MEVFAGTREPILFDTPLPAPGGGISRSVAIFPVLSSRVPLTPTSSHLDASEPRPPRSRRRALLSWFLRLAVTAGLCFFLIRRFDLSAVRPILAGFDPLCAVGALAVALLANVTYALGAGPLLRSAGCDVPATGLVRNHFVGLFFSLFLPTAVGGDVVRVIDLVRGERRASPAAAGAMILVQRLLALAVALAMIAGLMPLAAPEAAWGVAWVCGGILAAMGLGTLALSLSPTAGRIPGLPERISTPIIGARRHAGELWTTGRGRVALLKGIGWVLSSQLLFIFVTWLIGRGLRVDANPLHYFYVVPLGAVAVTAPVSVNGIGVREAVYIHYLGLVGIAPAAAAAISISLFVVNTFFACVGGLVWMIAPARRDIAERGPKTGPGAQTVVPGDAPMPSPTES